MRLMRHQATGKRYRNLTVVAALLAAVGIWWWYKQAPYRVASVFLGALQRGDIERLYKLSDPIERELLKLTPENFQVAYNTILSPFFQKWRLKEMRMHLYAKQFRLTLPPDYFPFTVIFEGEKGQVHRAIVATRWTKEGWRVSFGRFIYFLYLQSDDIPSSTKREILIKLLRAGFYAFPTERGEIYNTTTALQWLNEGRLR